MELKEIFNKYKVISELATMDIGLVEPRIRAGVEGKIRAAQSDLPKIEDEYKNKVANECAVIAVEGKFGKEFAEISQQFKTLPLDFLHAIDLIGDSILKRGGQDHYTSREHLMVMDELNKIKMNYRIATLPVFQAKFDGVGPGTKLKQALFHQITNQYGGQLYSAVTRGDIGDRAIKMGFQGKTLPVVLYNYATVLEPSMLPTPVGIIKIDEKPTKKSVKAALVEMRAKTKK